ncbi:SusD/RagB family nutrient-binding outer membrane lipoprotein [Oceanihabitans sp. 2_MG-2023]|uniref:SusD/RagB family nutrient-binding outer membrane lipoprotein n=1 Tax=Oceanihabitans sp. 2_MG-2023 TaxID=3062661 RepID=UPI0026E2A1E5|nr:SusD/RagB family nutrient-binding outer membrane lipoprotein [Oceanihabitans sp. 2_MG-2023]MDO6597856.1 SusD/RagB family nutrient-binding outer membrane lipoprotein [Oceanihabitans sp. 2_MG-2023]
MKNTKIIFLLFLSLVIASCDKDFEEVNTDPDNATEIPAHLLLGNIIRVNQNIIYNAQIGGDMGECWAQHWSKVQYNDEARYSPRRGNIDALWNSLYADVLSDAKSMYELAEAEGNSNLQAISLILQANAFQLLTDLYGPVPFAEALDSAIEQPAYSTSQEVYAGIIAMLNQADALFGSGDVTASSDLLYAGDVTKWEKFGNSLKFKVLMRSNGSAAELQALVTEGKMFTSNADSAQIIYNAIAPDANPIYETIVDGNRSEYKICSPVVDILSGLSDSRLAVYAGENADGNIVGKPAGYSDLPNDALGYTYGNISPLGDFYLDPTLPGVMLSHSQLKLLMAEAANEGKIGGGLTAAKMYMDEGIIASFEFNGLGDGATYAAGISLTGQADARQKIATQVWISLFGQGFESWTEWRRTGVPALTPAVEGDIPTIPTRLYYPTTEVSLNQSSYEAATATLNNGDELTSTLFWQ